MLVCVCGNQRGTNELKKYLRSRLEPEVLTQPAPTPVFQPVDGTSGIIGSGGDGVDRYRIASTKTLEYWCDIIQSFVHSVDCGIVLTSSVLSVLHS